MRDKQRNQRFGTLERKVKKILVKKASISRNPTASSHHENNKINGIPTFQ